MPGPLYRNLHTSDGNIVNVAFLDLLPQQALSTSRPLTPPIGSWIYETDTFKTMQYQSATTGWTPIWNLAWGIPAVPLSSSSNGTATAANTTEVKDAVIGDYTFTAVANRQYKLHVVEGLSGTAAQLVSIRVRDGGSSSPTTASTLIGSWTHEIQTTGGAGQVAWSDNTTFTATAGTHTFGLFTLGSAAGAVTPITMTGLPRQLWVEDIGPSGNPA